MNRRIHRTNNRGTWFYAMLCGCAVLAMATYGNTQGNIPATNYERHFPQSKSTLEKALKALERDSVVSKDDVAKAIHSYGLLRRIETTLRRFEDKTVSSVPGAKQTQQQLALRLGYNDFDVFNKDYLRARENIRELYQKYIRSTL